MKLGWFREGRESRIIAAGAALTVAAACLFLLQPRPLPALDTAAVDLLTGWGGSGNPSGRVAIVEIDEASVAQQGRWPWSRDRLALLVNRAFERGSAVLVLNAMFPEPDPDPAHDALLAEALARGKAVVGYSFAFGGAPAGARPCELRPFTLAQVGGASPAAFHASGALCSLPEIARAAAGTGFLNASPDADGKLRGLPVVIEYGGAHYPSLALAAASLYGGSPGGRLMVGEGGELDLVVRGRDVPLEGPAWLRLRFRGERAFPRVSAAALMRGGPGAEVLAGKIVLVGGTAAGLQNASATPASGWMPAVELQATAIDNLLQGDAWLRPETARLGELALLLVAGLASTALLALIPSLWSVITALALIGACWAGAALLLVQTRMLVSPLPMTLAVAANCFGLTLLKYLGERRRAERTWQQLASARESAQSALSQSEQRYQRLVENINDAIILMDRDGRLVFANRRFREWFGLQDAEIGELTLLHLLAAESRRAVGDAQQRLLRGEAVDGPLQFEAVRPSGTRIWIEALMTAVTERGQITGTQSALRDITERKRMEAQYLQAQKMESVGRLAGGVAHDFNNLLTVINGYSGLALSRLSENDPAHDSLKQILSAGQRAAELTQKLLMFSRKQSTQRVTVDLNAVVADTEKMLRRVIGEDIDLVCRLADSPGMVICDPGQMHQVLMNLVVNARDSMPNGGKLTISTLELEVDEASAAEHSGVTLGRYVRLSVADTGTGMSEEVMRHLFEPFFTTKEAGRGTGLGLATVYGIVNQSGGFIRVSSQPGLGSEFHIYLPLTEATAGQNPPERGSASSLRGCETVLLVEDQRAVRDLTATVLEDHGYRVLRASSSSEALSTAEEYLGRIHLLLTDVVLPGMNGRELADTLRKSRPGLKVLFVSGYAEETIARTGVLEASDVLLAKPYELDVLAAKVREALDGGRSRAMRQGE